jgi:hypothetical protein
MIMGKYRAIQDGFWQDDFILDLTAEEDRFYNYLLSNPFVKQTGIYELPMRMAEVQLKHNREKILELMGKFEKWGKIKYNPETKEVALKNWAKYNFASGNILICINKELEKVKDKSLIPFVYNDFEYYKDYIPSLSQLKDLYKTLQEPSRPFKSLQDPSGDLIEDINPFEPIIESEINFEEARINNNKKNNKKNNNNKEENLKIEEKDQKKENSIKEEISNLYTSLTGRFCNGNDSATINEICNSINPLNYDYELDIIKKTISDVFQQKSKQEPPDNKINGMKFFRNPVLIALKKAKNSAPGNGGREGGRYISNDLTAEIEREMKEFEIRKREIEEAKRKEVIVSG